MAYLILGILGAISGIISGITNNPNSSSFLIFLLPGILFGVFTGLYFVYAKWAKLWKVLLWILASIGSYYLAQYCSHFLLDLFNLKITNLVVDNIRVIYLSIGVTGGFLVALSFSLLIRRLSTIYILALTVLSSVLAYASIGDERSVTLFLVWQIGMALALALVGSKINNQSVPLTPLVSPDLQSQPSEPAKLFSKKFLGLPLGGIILLAVIALLVILGVARYGNTIGRGAETTPTNRDFFFSDLALSLNAPQLCEKITPGAVQGLGFNPAGYQVYYVKSDCYYKIAFLYRNPDLCSKVIEKKDSYIDGSRISPKGCTEDFQRDPSGEDNVAYGDPDAQLLQDAMKSVGYDDNKIISSAPLWADGMGAIGAESLYIELAPKNDFILKIKNAPSYDEKFSEASIRPANPNEYLYQRSAIENKNSLLCGKISPNAYYALKDNSAQPPTSRNVSVRDGCFTSIAFNVNNTSMCNQVSPKDSTSITNIYLNNREGCKDAIYNYYVKPPDLSWCSNKQQFPDQTSANKCRQDLSYKMATSYGPIDFPNGQSFVEALKNMGYTVSVQFTALDYLNFYQYIQRSGTSEQKNELKTKLENISSSF